MMLIGNSGRDPEVKTLDVSNGSQKVATFTLATGEKYKDRNGELRENTEWHNIVLWGGLAEVAEKYVHKGDRIYIEGKIRTNTYEDQNGIRRYRTEILAETMEMLSSRSGAAPVADTPVSGAPF